MTRRSLHVIVLAPLACLCAGAGVAQPLPRAPRSDYVIQARRLTAKPIIDGRMDDEAWTQAALVDRFTQLVPDEGAAASQRTEVRVGYDDDNLYLGFHCFDDEASKVVASILKRDEELTYDDYVNVLLDTYSDGQNGFLFAANALGAKVDAIVRKEGEEVNLAWDGLWECAGSRDATGWVAELRIPFKTLRFPKGDEQNWGINLGRFIARTREEAFWTPMQKSFGFNARYRISEFGRLASLRSLEQGLHLQVEPRVVGDLRDSPERDSSLTGGLDVKVNLASNLVADFSYKTDFADVETDEQQINLTRFSLYYPEKRGFFLEGADLFYVGERPEPYKTPETSLFFSRRIGLTDDTRREIPVLGGGKVTGKVGGLAVGLLNITTERFDTPAAAPVPRTNFSVARLRQDVFGKSSVGVLGLAKDEAGDGYNRLLAADWDFALHESVHTGGFLAKSYAPGLRGDDWAGYGDVYWDARHIRVRAAYTDIGANFDDELGFLTRTGIRKVRTNVTGILWPKKGWARQIWLTHALDYYTDRGWNLQTRTHTVELNVVSHHSSGVALKFYDNKEVLTRPFALRRDVTVAPGEYGFRNVFFGFNTDYAKRFGGAGWLQGGSYYDGRFYLVLAACTYRPVPGLLAQVIAQRTHVSVRGGTYDVDIVTGEANYAFTPRLLARATVQWRRDDNARTNVLLNWEYRPGSNLYLVYDETRLLPDGITWVRDRSLALKATYALGF